MFSLNEFLMKTIKGMIGNYPDFQVREYALKWYGKSLSDEDLVTIDTLIEAQYVEPSVNVEATEEVIEEPETEELETIE